MKYSMLHFFKKDWYLIFFFIVGAIEFTSTVNDYSFQKDLLKYGVDVKGNVVSSKVQLGQQYYDFKYEIEGVEYRGVQRLSDKALGYVSGDIVNVIAIKNNPELSYIKEELLEFPKWKFLFYIFMMSLVFVKLFFIRFVIKSKETSWRF